MKGTVIPSEARDLQLTFLPCQKPRNSEELFAQLCALGLRRIARCRLTRNRRVMVSHGAGELRVHEGYLAAPDDVLAAIVGFIEGRTRRDRAAARRRLLAFPIAVAPGRTRRETSHPDDRDAERRLTGAHGEYNRVHFGGALRPLSIRISRRMRARLGHYSATTAAGDPSEIAISRRHLRRDGWTAALETLLHEMVHQWQDETGKALDHGTTFRDKAREVGLPARGTREPGAGKGPTPTAGLGNGEGEGDSSFLPHSPSPSPFPPL